MWGVVGQARFLAASHPLGHRGAKPLARNFVRMVVDRLVAQMESGHACLEVAPCWAKPYSTGQNLGQTVSVKLRPLSLAAADLLGKAVQAVFCECGPRKDRPLRHFQIAHFKILNSLGQHGVQDVESNR